MFVEARGATETQARPIIIREVENGANDYIDFITDARSEFSCLPLCLLRHGNRPGK
jgi:hypothetical protein